MKTIIENIANKKFYNFYLLGGEEAYLRNQMRDRLKAALISDDDTMNYSYFEGKNINLDEVIQLGKTLPFFSERRVIVIENSGYFKSTPESLINIIDEFADTSYILFVDPEVDKRSKLYKKIKEAGYAAELTTPDEKSLIKWIKDLCKKENKEVSDSVIVYFLEHSGDNMSMIKNELEKLFSYTLNKNNITIQDINDICVTQVTNKIFDMMDAIGNMQQSKALNLYHDLLKLREPAMRILFLLTRQFNLVLQVKELGSMGFDNKAIASKAGIPPFTVKKYQEQSKKYKSEKLIDILNKCADVDKNIKTGQVSDIIGVELLIIEFSKKN